MTKDEPTKPKTAEEVIADPMFGEVLANEIKALIKARQLRPMPKPGYHYKRNWYDRMDSEGNLTPEFFIRHYPAILRKTCPLNAEFREVIKYVCEKAFMTILKHYYSQPIEK